MYSVTCQHTCYSRWCMVPSLSGLYHWFYHVSYFMAWNFADWVSWLLKTGYYVSMTPHLSSRLCLNLVASGYLNFQTKRLSVLIYKVLLYDSKAVVWYAMNAARIIGSITCCACLKGKMYCNNSHTEGDMKLNIQDVASFVSPAESWTEMNDMFRQSQWNMC